MTILRSIKFQIDINSDVWQDLRPKLKKVKVSSLEYYVFLFGNTQNSCWRTVSMAATAKNYNLLMQNVNSLGLFHLLICFSSRHDRKQEEICVAIARPYIPLEKGRSLQRKGK